MKFLLLILISAIIAASSFAQSSAKILPIDLKNFKSDGNLSCAPSRKVNEKYESYTCFNRGRVVYIGGLNIEQKYFSPASHIRKLGDKIDAGEIETYKDFFEKQPLFQIQNINWVKIPFKRIDEKGGISFSVSDREVFGCIYSPKFEGYGKIYCGNYKNKNVYTAHRHNGLPGFSNRWGYEIEEAYVNLKQKSTHNRLDLGMFSNTDGGALVLSETPKSYIIRYVNVPNSQTKFKSGDLKIYEFDRNDKNYHLVSNLALGRIVTTHASLVRYYNIFHKNIDSELAYARSVSVRKYERPQFEHEFAELKKEVEQKEERITKQNERKNLIAKQKAKEVERIAKAKREKIAKQKAERERIARQKAERERKVAEEKAERERIAKAKEKQQELYVLYTKLVNLKIENILKGKDIMYIFPPVKRIVDEIYQESNIQNTNHRNEIFNIATLRLAEVRIERSELRKAELDRAYQETLRTVEENKARKEAERIAKTERKIDEPVSEIVQVEKPAEEEKKPLDTSQPTAMIKEVEKLNGDFYLEPKSSEKKMNAFKKTLLVLGTVAGLSGNAEAHHYRCEKSTFPGAVNAESYTCRNDVGDLVYTGQLDSKNLKFDGFGVSMTENFAYMGMWKDGKMNGHFIRFDIKSFENDTRCCSNTYYYNYAFVAKNDALETGLRVPTLESKGLRDYAYGMIDTVLNQQGTADVYKHNTIYNNTIKPDVVISKQALDEKSKPIPVAKVSKSTSKELAPKIGNFVLSGYAFIIFFFIPIAFILHFLIALRTRKEKEAAWQTAFNLYHKNAARRAEEARRRQEEEEARRQAEEARRQEEEEARREGEETRRILEEEFRKAEEARRRAEEAKRRAYEARRRQEEARRRAEEEETKRRGAEEETRRRQDEARRRAEEARQETRRRAEEARRRAEDNQSGASGSSSSSGTFSTGKVTLTKKQKMKLIQVLHPDKFQHNKLYSEDVYEKVVNPILLSVQKSELSVTQLTAIKVYLAAAGWTKQTASDIFTDDAAPLAAAF
jgi:hypothetical protein